MKRRNQAGASLYIALVAIIVVVGIVGPLSLLSATAVKSTGPYVIDAEKRAAGDSSLKAAVNYVARNTTLGRDPAIYPSDPTCGYRVPSTETGSVPVTVTCRAVTGSDSGVPAETGKVPDQALLLLGQRYGDVPAYSPCTGWPINDRRNTNGREWGLTVDPAALQKSGSTTDCVANNGAIDPDKGLWVNGDIRSNAPVRVAGGSRLTVDNGTIETGTSPYFYLNGSASSCSGSILTSASGSVSCASVSTTRDRTAPASGDPANPFDPGEDLFTDPALDSSRGADWRLGRVNWSAPYVSFNGATPVALTDTTTIACAKNQNLIRFYPGLYKSATALNRIFSNTSCSHGADPANPKAGIFWFGPAENNSNSTPSGFSLDMLSSGGTAQQGVYAFDFRDTGAGTSCAAFPNTNYPHRWCLYPDSSNDNGGIVVGGWPTGWDPSAVVAAPSNSTSNFTSMVLSPPTAFDEDDSHTWSTPSQALTFGNGNTATYSPGAVFSTNRSIILSGFGTVDSVESGGNILFKVRHQESNSGLLNSPELLLSTLDRGTPVSCGTFKVPKSADNNSMAPDALQTHVISANQATDTTGTWNVSRSTQLRTCFSNPERIRNLSVKWQVSGDSFNKGSCSLPQWLAAFCPAAQKPRVFLDGIEITVDAPTGGFFTSDAPVPATYCDSSKPGVQFIFGGDSTVHTGTAGMQLCAGPAPTNPEDYQQIAVWAQPVNFLLKKNGSGQTETRVGKTGNVSLTPSNASTAVTYCGPVWFGIGCFQTPWWENASRAIRPNNPYTDTLAPSVPVKANYNAGRAVSTVGNITLGGFGKIVSYGSSGCQVGQAADRDRNLCIDTATQSVSKVSLKVNYTTACPDASSTPWWLQVAFNWVFCSGLSATMAYDVSGTGWSCSGEMPAMQPSKLSWWYLDVTNSCFSSDANTRLVRLNDSNLKVKLTFPCTFCTANQKQVEGVELLTSISSTSSGESIAPATGCRVGPIGFGAGVGDPAPLTHDSYLGVTSSPDCALISSAPPVVSAGDVIRPGGRVSVQGTIYAPSDALEIADGDVMYPFASRGLVARHLRVRGMAFRPPYNEPSIENEVDKTANSRQVELTACVRQASDVTTPCGDLTGDQIVARAGVRFAEDTGPSAPTSPPSARMRVPQVMWWNTEKRQ